MRLSHFVLAVSLLSLAARVSAQEPPATPNLTLVQQLERFAAGKPIPLVVAAYGHQTASPKPPAVTAGKEWLPALQALAETVSPPGDRTPSTIQIQENYIPFQLGNVWTLAPDRQWRLNLDLTGVDMYAASTPEALKQWLVASMSPEQMAKAGGDGLRWKDWTPDQQALLAALMRRPFRVSGAEPPSRLLPFTGSDPGRRPFPVARSTFRLRMVFDSFYLPRENGRGGQIYALPPSAPTLGFETRSDVVIGTNVPYRVAESARLKPGDLNFDAPALDRPIGLHGITTLKDTVAAAAKATGQDLKLSPEFDKMPVFIGDASMRTGDILKALTFGIQGAWRKVGSTRLLAWDRVGRGAVRLWQEEAVRPLDRAVDHAQRTMLVFDTSRLLLDNLKPDPDDSLAPTPDQIKQLTTYGPRDLNTGYPSIQNLTFAEMTPEQQAIVRDAIKTSPSFPYNGMPSEDDMQRLTIRSLLAVATLDAPGVGALGLGEMAEIMRQSDAGPPPPKAADWPPRNLPADGSLKFSQEVRAVAAPMLLRSEWPRLIEQMRRKGLNTLFVPVLWDGQTLYPSRYFPQPESLHGHDALAEILAAASLANIKVVGVLNTLAWRFPGGSEVHWMRKHRDWLEVDILGRTRREWLAPEHAPTGPGDGSDWAEDPLVYSDYVRPDVPAVHDKLMGLVTELRHYPGLGGVALDHWMRSGGRDYQGPAPPLGFTMEERAAVLAKTGKDPVDQNAFDLAAMAKRSSYSFFLDPWEAMSTLSAEGEDFSSEVYSADAALANEMLRSLGETWPGRLELFNPLAASTRGLPDSATVASIAPGVKRPLPEANAVISSQPVSGQSGQYRWLPAPKLTDDPATNDQRFARAAVRMQRLAAPTGEGKKPLTGVVLDFTTAPDLLWPCLRLIANEPDNAAGVR